ncbi:hypothetical protein ABFB09_00165 [Dehalogenimonas sp. THU2]|uniref:hypothetical protein n=1 Tax=Dehalogenimonas sp. THU2 TaxID=3151121 RepID=UPI00321841DF
MKRWCWLITLLIPAVLLAGCTSNSNYQLALDENTTLNAQNSDLSAQLDAMRAQYEDIAKVFPPRDFGSLQELNEWLSKDNTNETPTAANIEDQYSKGLQQQLAALKDGFIISVDQEYINEFFSFVLGIAVIDGELWVWDIDTDEPYQPIGWGKVSRGS